MSTRERICGLCGKPATGLASIWTEGAGQVWYCHGDGEESPTCYERADRKAHFIEATDRATQQLLEMAASLPDATWDTPQDLGAMSIEAMRRRGEGKP